MVSDIKSLDPRQLSGAHAGKTNAARGDSRPAAAQRTGSSGSEDTVELSGGADLVRTVARRIATSGAPVDEARVRELRHAIADGSYQPDPARIARKLIDADTLL